GHRVGDAPYLASARPAPPAAPAPAFAPIRDPQFAKTESATAVDAGSSCGAVAASRARVRRRNWLTRPLLLNLSEPQRSEPQRGASERERPLAVLWLGPSCRRRPVPRLSSTGAAGRT